VLSITNNGTKVEFTGKQIGNSTITATLGDQTRTALVRVRAIEVAGSKKYFTYNKPAQYYIIVKNLGFDGKNTEFAYDGKQFARVEGNEVDYRAKNPYASLSSYDNRSGWADYTEIDKHSSDYRRSLYNLDNVWSRPCYFFNLYLCSLKANRQGEEDMFPLTWDNNFDENYKLADWEIDLQNYDVTKYYLRSEIINGVECNVFSGKGNVGQAYTFWVDKTNGLTLKFTDSRETQAFEVTTYQLTVPNWNGLHLRPQAGDAIVEP